MKYSTHTALFVCLFGTIALLVTSLLSLGATDLWSAPSSSVGPRVRITSGPMEHLVLDNVDFERDTVGDIIRRIPAWFGSQSRPLGLTVHNLLLKEDVPLRAQGLSSLTHITLVSMKEVRLDKEVPAMRATGAAAVAAGGK
ncbi:hypothetical protein NESM_000236300 [Novymonas esmeraldas]|uniref:Uncharacterized protein n=1 Tax=Novymonas esmeraldas TaxID=1808958 RepID=A0AAW0F9S4_9TRYP